MRAQIDGPGARLVREEMLPKEVYDVRVTRLLHRGDVKAHLDASEAMERLTDIALDCFFLLAVKGGGPEWKGKKREEDVSESEG